MFCRGFCLVPNTNLVTGAVHVIDICAIAWQTFVQHPICNTCYETTIQGFLDA